MKGATSVQEFVDSGIKKFEKSAVGDNGFGHLMGGLVSGLVGAVTGTVKLIAVADEAGGGGKIGGAAGGSSKIVLAELDKEIQSFAGKGFSPEQVKARLETAVERAHEKILASGGGAYTTVAVLRKGKIVFQTEEDNIGRQLFSGARTVEDQAAAIRQANVLRNAVGGPGEFRADVRITDYQPGDRVLAFSDGVGDARLHQAASKAERSVFQKEWHGDQTLKDLVSAMMNEPAASWAGKLKEIVMRWLGHPQNAYKSPEESLKAVRELVEYFTQKGWAKPDDVAFGVLDLK